MCVYLLVHLHVFCGMEHASWVLPWLHMVSETLVVFAEFPPFAEYICRLKQTIETDIDKYEAVNKEKDGECVQR